MQYEIKTIITLVYLQSYRDSYEYQELKSLLGFNTTQLKEFLDKLVEEMLVNDKESLLLTEKSKTLLKELGLENIDINLLTNEKTSIVISKDKFSFEDIYIPKNFKL